MDFEVLKHSYLIVEFPNERTTFLSVELIPKCWAYRCENGNWNCRYPPTETPKKIVRDWIYKGIKSESSWPSFAIKILSKASDYKQGYRRLQRSLTQKKIDSSDIELNKKYHPVVLSSSVVKNVLSKPLPLKHDIHRSAPPILEKKHDAVDSSTSLETSSDESVGLNVFSASVPLFQEEDSITDSVLNKDKLTRAQTPNNYSQESSEIPSSNSSDFDTNLKLMFDELKIFIDKKLNNIKSSLLYDFEKKIKHLHAVMEKIESSANNEEPWVQLDAELPIATLEEFLKFDQDIKENLEKQKALKDIMKLVTIGSNNPVSDVQNIIAKIIKKSVQLLYSGTGRKIKGVGKRSFKDTECFKCMNDFLMVKYKDSDKKLNILTSTSHFLSGAVDREGGRAQRTTENTI